MGRGARFVVLVVLGGVITVAAIAARVSTQSPGTPDARLFEGLRFRNIGPAAMGGRIDDFAVLESNPAVFYVATATGGLWLFTACSKRRITARECDTGCAAHSRA